MTRLTLVLMSLLLALAGCATDPLAAYPEAQTVRECEVLAQADERQRRAAAAAQPSSGDFLIDAIAGGVGAGVLESSINARLNGCIARVTGAVPVDPAAPVEEFVIADPGGVVIIEDEPIAASTPSSTVPLGSELPETTAVAPSAFSPCPQRASVLYGGARYCVKGAR